MGDQDDSRVMQELSRASELYEEYLRIADVASIAALNPADDPAYHVEPPAPLTLTFTSN